MKRRQLFAGTAVVAGLAGAALAWRSQSVKAVQSPVRGLVLPTPDGGSLSVDAFADRQVVLNFWATWCPPCVHELPLLSRFHLEHAQRGWQVLGIAIDDAAAVSAFLRKTPLSFPVGMAKADGLTLTRQLGNEQGALPFTVLLNRQGHITQRKIGQLSSSDLNRWVQSSPV